MCNNNDSLDKNQEINKEDKYREEIFQLLKSTFKETDSEESELLKKLFLKETIENDQLLKFITSLK
jgi:hypothetical protein